MNDDDHVMKVRRYEAPRVKFSETPKRHSDESPTFAPSAPTIGEWTGDRFHLPLETPEQFAATRKLLLAQFKNEPAAARALQSDASEVGRASGWRTRKGAVPKLTKAQLAEANARIEAMAKAIPK